MYKENHSLGEWFKKAYGDEKEKGTPFAIIEVRSANNTLRIAKGDIHVRMNDNLQFIMGIMQFYKCKKNAGRESGGRKGLRNRNDVDRASITQPTESYYTFDVSARNKGLCPHSDNHQLRWWLCSLGGRRGPAILPGLPIHRERIGRPAKRDGRRVTSS